MAEFTAVPEPSTRQPWGAVALEAIRLREQGRLDQSVARLRAGADLNDPAVALLYLRFMFELQDYAGLQHALRRMVMKGCWTERHGGDLLQTVIWRSQLTCLPPDLIDKLIEDLRDVVGAFPQAAAAWSALEKRQKFRRRVIEPLGHRARIISLGLHCLPWDMPSRWGLRSEAGFVEDFTPFALAGHTTDGLIDALERDFDRICDPAEVVVVETVRGFKMAVRRDRGAYWNHNRGAYWLADDLAPLRQALADYAERFRQACRDPNAVFVLAKCPIEYPEERLTFLPRLDKALARFTGRTGNRIVISNQTSLDRPKRIVRVNPSAFFLSAPYPSAEYVWHDETQSDSEAGLDYERGYVNFLLRAIQAWGLAPAREPTAT